LINKQFFKKSWPIILIYLGVSLVACANQSPSEKAQEKINRQTNELLLELEDRAADTLSAESADLDTTSID
jgi:hypothetical protein